MDFLSDFKTSAIHVFPVSTLFELGFKCRVTLANKSDSLRQFATDYQVKVDVFKNGGLINSSTEIETLKKGHVINIDCNKFLGGDDSDGILIFSLIPVERSTDRLTKISRNEIFQLIGAQDHYLEYFNDMGYSAGVLYQSAPMNYSKFGNNWSTMIQAPKIYSSSELTTYLQVANCGFDDNYNKNAVISLILVNSQGQTIDAWKEEVNPFQSRLINLSKRAKNGNEIHFCTLYAICKDVTVLPMTITHNNRSDTLAIEHSLPPVYYGASISGGIRQGVLKTLTSLDAFR